MQRVGGARFHIIATHILLKRGTHSGNEPLATLCPTWLDQDLNLELPFHKQTQAKTDEKNQHSIPDVNEKINA